MEGDNSFEPSELCLGDSESRARAVSGIRDSLSLGLNNLEGDLVRTGPAVCWTSPKREREVSLPALAGPSVLRVLTLAAGTLSLGAR